MNNQKLNNILKDPNTNWKYVLIVVLLAAVVGGGILWRARKQQIPPTKFHSKKEITIATNKTEYEQGGTIEITIRNNLDKSIWYIKTVCPPSCCNLYRWEEDKWKNLGDPMSCIQLIPLQSGEPFYIEPNELRPAESMSKQWDDMIIERRETAESGKYRFSFYYGLSKNDYTSKTIYSNEFIVKETCIDSNEQCRGKPDGAGCTYGVWCDEQKRICGGQSCAGLAVGQCFQEKCLVINQQIIDKCGEETEFIKQVRSDPDCLKGEEFRCVDGWGEKWYYDKRLVSTTEFPSTFPSKAPEELKEATVAKHASSICNCKDPISYEILVEDKFEKTTCEKFYKFIEDYNSSCNNCLRTWSFECC